MSRPSKSYWRMKATHDCASLARDSALAAAGEKLPDQVQPPTEIIVRRCGWACFNFCS